MKRNLRRLTDTQFDVLIIGGGINGACIAWDASLRGLSVALIDKADLGAATSANSLKIIHGGLRYLQHADLPRMRASILERSTLLRIAPHLVHPLPFVLPTYGGMRQSREALSCALMINDLIGFDRNRSCGADAFIPRGRVISRGECMGIFPGFDRRGLTGGAVWYDCMANNSERLTLAFHRSAADLGAVIANYTQARAAITKKRRIYGVRAVDMITGDEIDVYARMVVNAAGPWVFEVMRQVNHVEAFAVKQQKFALALNLVVRKSFGNMGFCLRSKTPRERDPICGGNRFLFLVPWRGYTLLGTSYKPFNGLSDNSRVGESDLVHLLGEFNEACPELQLDLEDVTLYHKGLLPLNGAEGAARATRLAREHRIIDHAVEDGIQGMISVVGIKYTMARAVAQQVTDLVFRRLGSASLPGCRTSQVPVHGGDLPGDRHWRSDCGRWTHSPRLSEGAIRHLERHYGSCAGKVIGYLDEAGEWARPLEEGSSVLRCEVVHAVREEMAVKLSDVVMRRTELGTASCPSREALASAARIMGEELGWDNERQSKEIEEVIASYAPLNLLR